MRRIRVLFSIAAPGTGGIRTDLMKLFKGFAKESRISPIVCCLHPCENRLSEAYESQGVPFYYIKCSRRNRFRFTMEFARVLRVAMPDVLDIWSHLSLMEQTIGARIARVPAVATRVYYYSARPMARFARCVQTGGPVGLIDAYTAVSVAAARVIRLAARMGRAPVRVIYNGVDLKRFSTHRISGDTTRVEMDCPRGAFIIGGIGRLSPEKGFSVLIRAAARVFEDNPDVILAIGGGGTRGLAELDTLAKTLGIRGKLVLKGWVAQAEDFYSSLDVLIVPSLSEGLPNVLLEGMASGLPIIASDVGGIPEALRGVGRLVPPGDPTALAEAILDVLNDDKLRSEMSKKARKQAEGFTIESFVDAYASFYEELYERKVVQKHRHARALVGPRGFKDKSGHSNA